MSAHPSVAATSATSLSPTFVTFLNQAYHGQHPIEKVGNEVARELRTLAESLNDLSDGSLPELGDRLVQRFKA